MAASSEARLCARFILNFTEYAINVNYRVDTWDSTAPRGSRTPTDVNGMRQMLLKEMHRAFHLTRLLTAAGVRETSVRVVLSALNKVHNSLRDVCYREASSTDQDFANLRKAASEADKLLSVLDAYAHDIADFGVPQTAESQRFEHDMARATPPLGSRVRLLHLSDFHVGATEDHGTLWSNMKGEFFEDLDYLFDQQNPCHAILFTGDLVFKGTANNFNKLDSELDSLIGHLEARTGVSPFLLAVPGNHDVLWRTDKKYKNAARDSLEAHAAENLLREFWDNAESQLGHAVELAFANYRKWWQERGNKPRDCTMDGKLPGEFAATFTAGDLKIGVVGLNTTTVQIGEGDYEEKLLMHPKQIGALFPNGIHKWCADLDISFLMTHHGESWLCNDAKDVFRTEVYPEGRFALHLHGHLHEAHFWGKESGGAPPRRYLQGPSLFGLEKWTASGNQRNRIHGFVAIEIQRLPDGSVCFRLFPRKKHDEFQHVVANLDDFYLLKGADYTDWLSCHPRKALSAETRQPTP